MYQLILFQYTKDRDGTIEYYAPAQIRGMVFIKPLFVTFENLFGPAPLRGRIYFEPCRRSNEALPLEYRETSREYR